MVERNVTEPPGHFRSHFTGLTDNAVGILLCFDYTRWMEAVLRARFPILLKEIVPPQFV
jgi:hypothetical protein